jgi:hypothetical protein
MTTQAPPSRRSFLKSGVLLAPLAAAPAAALAEDGVAPKLARLEAEAAVRALHAQWLRRINTGDRAAAAALFADPRLATVDDKWLAITAPADAEPPTIEISTDARRACGRYACVIESVIDLPLDSSFAQMAHAQGGGYIRQAERKIMIVDYVRNDTGWAIGRTRLANA